jgi:hypothetical protein
MLFVPCLPCSTLLNIPGKDSLTPKKFFRRKEGEEGGRERLRNAGNRSTAGFQFWHSTTTVESTVEIRRRPVEEPRDAVCYCTTGVAR